MDPQSRAPRTPVTKLKLAKARGVWAVRSESPSFYLIDADRGRLIRVWGGEGSQAFSFDNEWVPLVDVTSHRSGREAPRPGVRVGERPRYLTDPRGGVGAYEWRLQREVTAIEPVTEEQVVALGVPAPDGEHLDGHR